MYDVTELSTLGGLQLWYDNALRDSNNTSNTLYFLVGNKIDETGDIEVTEKRAASYAADVLKLPTDYTVSFQISAKTGEGLNSLLEQVTHILADHSKQEQKQDNNNIIMDRIDGKKNNTSHNCQC